MSGPSSKKRKKNKKSKGKSKKPGLGYFFPTFYSSFSRRYHCNICKNDISSEIRIKCQECDDFDMCVGCFYEGNQHRKHKNNHKYSVISDISTPIFATGWGGEEELLLLEGVEMFGLGNWEAISEHIGTKSKHEAEYHYNNVYIDNDFPPPQGKLTREDKVSVVEKDDSGMIVQILKERGRPPFFISQKGKFDNVKKNRDGGDMGAEVGYLPLRRSFLTQHSEEIEKTIEDMRINNNDPPDVKLMKQKMIRQYNYKIDERERRTKFVIERDLFDHKKFRSEHKKRTREEKDAFNKMKKFMRFIPSKDFNLLMNGLYTQIYLENEIKRLQHYRKNGITTFLQSKKYETDRKRRDPNFKQKRGSRKQEKEIFPDNTDLLSEDEKSFLRRTHIPLNQYLLIKDVMIKENFKLGYLTRGSIKKFLHFEMKYLTQVYDFLLISGWIQNKIKKRLYSQMKK